MSADKSRIAARYAAAFGMAEADLFGGEPAPAAPGVDLNGRFTPDDEERLVAAARAPRRHDPGVVDALAAVLDGQRRTEDVIGSVPLLGAVAGQLDVVTDLVIEARGDLRPKVVHVAGQWAQFNGWLRANAGYLDEGTAWLDRALEWAVEADDPNLTSEVLSFKGHVAWMGEQIGPVIGLSAAAIRAPGLYPGQYAISAAQEARGHGMAGDTYEMERKLDQADEQAAAARARPDGAPPWLYYHSPGFFELQRGLAYRYAGHYEPAYNLRAADALTRGLAELPAEMRDSEWAGEFVYQLGRAYRQAGELELAAELGGELSALARQIGSKRLVEQAVALR